MPTENDQKPSPQNENLHNQILDMVSHLRSQTVDHAPIKLRENIADIELKEGVSLDAAQPFAIENQVPFEEELNTARAVHTHVARASHKLRTAVKDGISSETIQEIALAMHGTVDSILRNQDALLSMARLKKADEYTFSHCVNVSIYATVLGRRIQVTPESLHELAFAGFLHDIGKMLIPQQVLNFKGRLDDTGMQIMQSHVVRGGSYLETVRDVPEVVRTGVLEHHERFNGTGYPYGKKEQEISLVGQVMTVADIYDALTSERCYKKAYPPEKALAIMYKDRGIAFSPGLLEMFIDAMGIYPVGNLVELSNHYLAVVIERGKESPVRPVVVTLFNDTAQALKEPRRLDLEIHRSISILHSITHLPTVINLENAVWRAAHRA